MYKYIFFSLLCVIFIGCDGCDTTKNKTLSTKQQLQEIQKEESAEVQNNTHMNNYANIDKNRTQPNNTTGKNYKNETNLSKKASSRDTDVLQTATTLSPELEELGSPLNPYPDMGEDIYDPNSPQNAKPSTEKLENLPMGHPLKAQKIDKNDPDLLKKGSPANPIEDFTGEDIAQ